MSKMMEKELSAVEAARQAGIRLDVLYPLLRVGRIPARRKDGRWIISAADLKAYLAQRDERHAGK
jgi:predicted site-specific integrase-resolvase